MKHKFEKLLAAFLMILLLTGMVFPQIQPFINKMGGAIASGIVGATVIISGISSAASKADVTEQGLLILKLSMLAIPLLCILAGYLIYRLKYRIDEKMYKQILSDLKARGDIKLKD
jgi:Na+/melibiose symporter-like transporter